MTYIKHTSRKGTSTILISSRIQRHTIEFVEEHNFVFGRFVNQALWTFVHDLQTDHELYNEKYWLTASGPSFSGYETNGKGSVPKMIRVRADLIEYLKLNKFQVNTAINLACDRWRRYYVHDRVADYIIYKITDHKKA